VRPRRRSIPAQSPPGWDRFLQLDFHAAADSQFAPQRIDGAIHKIFLHRFRGEQLVPLDAQRSSLAARSAQPQFVLQRDGLKNGPQFVKSIFAFAEDIQRRLIFANRECGLRACAELRLRVTCRGFLRHAMLRLRELLLEFATLSVSMSAGSERRHSTSDFSHSAAARLPRPVLAYRSPRCE